MVENKNRNRSKEMWREPTQTKSLREKYARKITKLFDKFAIQTIDLLSRMIVEPAAVRINKKETIEFQKDPYLEVLDDLAVKIILNPVKEIIHIGTRESHQAGVTFSKNTLKRAGIEVEVGEKVDEKVTKKLEEETYSYLEDLTDEQNQRIVSQLKEGIERGESIPKLAKRIQEQVEMGKGRAEMIARTETLRAFNRAAEDRYKIGGIEMFEWLTAHDERLCELCEELDGITFSVTSNHERPPLHPRCRCTIVPMIE